VVVSEKVFLVLGVSSWCFIVLVSLLSPYCCDRRSKFNKIQSLPPMG